MLKLTIEIEAKSESGLEISLEECLKKVKEGYYSGMDGNDDESYSFQRTGEEEPITEES